MALRDDTWTAAADVRQQGSPRETRRVLIIVENTAASQDHRVVKQIDTLLGAGYSVTVITQKHPGNRVYHGRPGLRLLEYPAPLEPRRKLDYLIEYGYSFLAAAFCTCRAVLSERMDVVQFCQPPDIYFPLAKVLRLLGVRVLVDQRDLLPELYAARYGATRPLLSAALRQLERQSHRNSDRIICTNEYQLVRAIATSGLSAECVSIVGTGPVLARVTSAQRDESLKRGRPYLCCWVGVMGLQDRLDLLMHSIGYAVHELERKDCQFVVIGDGESLAMAKALADELKLGESVYFTGDLPADKVFRYLATADLGVDAGLQPDITPVKLLEYMAFGVPIVAFDLPETRVLVHGAAALAEAGNVSAHAREVDGLLRNMKQRRELGEIGEARVRDKLAWDHQARVYLDVIAQLCRSGAASAWPGSLHGLRSRSAAKVARNTSA
jgi:glycosyltransferase involved in cell wall biosynthesis